MPISRRQFLAGALGGAVLLLLPATRRTARGDGPMLLGVALVTQQHPDWQAVQLPILRAMRADIVRIPVGKGFGNSPAMLADLVAAGVGMVILQVDPTDSGGTMAAKTQRDLLDAGWLDAARTAGVQVLVELGNEPDNTPQAPSEFAADVTQTAALVRPHAWVAVSLPTTLAYTQAIAPTFALCDALCPHLYGGGTLGDAAAREQPAVIDWVYQTTRLPLYLTEVGINDPTLPMTTKASRILTGLAGLDANRIKGATIFTISDDPSWADYAITPAAAAVLGARIAAPAFQSAPAPADPFAPVPDTHEPNTTWFPETAHSIGNGFKAAWEHDGGLAIFGYPLSQEFIEDGVTVQYFERAVFEYHPGEWPSHWDVEFRRLGALAAQARGYLHE